MDLVNLFAPPSYWYSLLAIIVSAYQGWRGWIFQYQFAKMQLQQNPSAPGARTRTQRVLVRALADCQFYFVTTLAGFATLLLAARILFSLPSFENVSGGTSALLIFLFTFGILGMTGKLPDLIHQGKFPR